MGIRGAGRDVVYVIDGSKTPMLYYYDSERSFSFQSTWAYQSVSDALGTMLIRRAGQLLLFGKNLKRCGAILRFTYFGRRTLILSVIAADNFAIAKVYN